MHNTVFEYTTNLVIQNMELFLKMQDVKEWLQQRYKPRQFLNEWFPESSADRWFIVT
jgi:hypothetical protein